MLFFHVLRAEAISFAEKQGALLCCRHSCLLVSLKLIAVVSAVSCERCEPGYGYVATLSRISSSRCLGTLTGREDLRRKLYF